MFPRYGYHLKHRHVEGRVVLTGLLRRQVARSRVVFRAGSGQGRVSIRLRARVGVVPRVGVRFPMSRLRRLDGGAISLTLRRRVFLFYLAISVGLPRGLRYRVVLLVLEGAGLVVHSRRFYRFFRGLLLFSSGRVHYLQFGVFLLASSSRHRVGVFRGIVMDGLEGFSFVFLRTLVSRLPRYLSLVHLVASSSSFRAILLCGSVCRTLARVGFTTFRASAVSQLLVGYGAVLLVDFLGLPRYVHRHSFEGMGRVARLL